MRVLTTILGTWLVTPFGAGCQSESESQASQTLKGRENILRLLDQIVLERVRFERLPLVTVVEFLQQQARVHDPERRGIDFFIEGSEASPSPLARAVINIDPPFKNIRLRDVLQGVVEVSNVTIEMSVGDDGVRFSAAPVEPLLTRTFKVDPGSFIQNRRDVLGLRLEAGGINGVRSSQAGNSSANRMELMQDLQQLLRQFFAAVGVNFPGVPVEAGGGALEDPLAPTEPEIDGKAFFFNDRTGLVFVRATSSELAIIEQAILGITAPPQQLTVDIKVLELAYLDSRAIGFDWIVGPNSELGKIQAPQIAKYPTGNQGGNPRYPDGASAPSDPTSAGAAWWDPIPNITTYNVERTRRDGQLSRGAGRTQWQRDITARRERFGHVDSARA